MPHPLKGIQIHRGIVYGSHARLLTKEEKLKAPDQRECTHDVQERQYSDSRNRSGRLPTWHAFTDTHKWTVFFASAASPPPKIKHKGKGKGKADEVEPDDINYIPGGADDLSWLIKRVTFKLHETYHQPNRGENFIFAVITCSKPSVTLIHQLKSR
jgi:YEATS domain-containing protein 4